MKTFKLFIYLFPLLLVTAQASQESSLWGGNNQKPKQSKYSNVNRDNTNEKSSYKHGDIQGLEKWLRNVKFKDLHQPLEELSYDSIAHSYTHIKKLYTDNAKVYHKVYSEYDKKTKTVKKIEPKYYQHIKDTPKVYFVVGPKGSGKSTLIFALQGNQITKKEKKKLREWSDSESDNTNVREGETNECDNGDDNVVAGDLILKQTVNVLTPEVATNLYGTTEGVKIYYTGKKIEKPMTFCDTEGFLGIRKEDISNAKKIVASYAPYFVLKSNNIGGIVFVVSAEDLGSTGGGSFMASARFLKDYFDVGMIDKNRQILKKSIMLVINKEMRGKESVLKQLALYIKESYEDYYKGLREQNKQQYNQYLTDKVSEFVKGTYKYLTSYKNNNQKSSQQEPRVGQLKHFLSLFLKQDVQEHEMNKVNFFKLLDTKNIRFSYPYKSDKVVKMRQKLAQLNPIDSKYLSLYDGPVSQHLINKMVHRASEVNDIITNIHKHLTSAQKNKINNKEDLKKFISQQKEKKDKLEEKNRQLQLPNDKDLEEVFEGRHQEDIPFKRKHKSSWDVLDSSIDDGVKEGVEFGTRIFGFSWGILGGFGLMLTAPASLPVMGLGLLAGGVVGGVVGGATGGATGGIIGTVEGVCKVWSNYQGYLYHTCAYTGGEPIYKIEMIESNGGRIGWVIPNGDTIAELFNEEDSCLIAKDKEGITLKRWRILHTTAFDKNARFKVRFYSRKCDLSVNKTRVDNNKNEIESVEKIIEEQTNTLKKDTIYNNSMKEAKKLLQKLAKMKGELETINCWKEHIFRKNSINHHLVAENIAIYNKVWLDILPEYKISINKTNQKHTNHQWLDKDDTKEDYENNNNNQNNPSGSNVSASVSITTLLSILLNEIKKQSR